MKEEEVMPNTTKHVTIETKSANKKRNRIDPLQNVISLRINDAEKESLDKLARTTSKNISDILREAIDLWCSKRNNLCAD
jgi:predicted DNA-binding protein